MKVTNVTIIKVDREDQPSLKAYATIVIEGELLIRNIRIIEGKNGFFASMPSRRRSDGSYQNLVHPVNADLREVIETAIFSEYNHVISTGTKAETEESV